MAKTWVLDTETKGTGASMVPLESVLAKPGAKGGRPWVPPPGTPRVKAAPPPRRPRAFRVVDVLTRQTLGEGDIKQAVAILRQSNSPVDVNVYVWEPKRDKWRLLSLREKHALWGFRDG